MKPFCHLSSRFRKIKKTGIGKCKTDIRKASAFKKTDQFQQNDPLGWVSFFLKLVCLSQSRRLPLLQVVSNNKSFSVGVQSPTEINAPRGCAVILRRICQLSLTRITHQVSRAFDLNKKRKIISHTRCSDICVTVLLRDHKHHFRKIPPEEHPVGTRGYE